MSLSALPAEILSNICRFIVLKDKPPCSISRQSFKSLRSTCREIYRKTLFDAREFLGVWLSHLFIKLTPTSLNVLLDISHVPYFRDRVIAIRLEHPCVELGTTFGRKDYESSLRNEDMDTFANSHEAVYILAECLRNFSKSPRIPLVHIHAPEAHPTVFNALKLAQYPCKLDSIVVGLAEFRLSEQDRVLSSLRESSHSISDLAFAAPFHPDNLESYARKQDTEDNVEGYHYSGYRPITPALSRLAAGFTNVEALAFHGCAVNPRLRLCHGCDDMWINLLAKQTYPYLTSLELWNSYISGGRLGNFIKRHASTLQSVYFTEMYLTDGTWRSIAQGLQKCSSLEHLDMGSVSLSNPNITSPFQKHAAPRLDS